MPLTNKLTQNTAEILKILNIIAKGIENENDYSFHYFSNQLMRYYHSLIFLKNNIPKCKVLDVGSYPSHMHQCLLLMGYEADGADILPERISNNLPECKNRTFKWDFETSQCPIPDQQYDCILFLEVIEHLHVNPLAALESISHLTKRNGLLFLTTPNLFSFKNRLNFLKGTYVFEHPLSVYEKLERHGSRGHQRLYSVQELRDILDVYGFEVENIWCIDEKNPHLSQRTLRPFLPNDFSFDRFRNFWIENVSFKGRIRRKLEDIFYKFNNNFNSTIYLIARKTGSYDKEKMYEKICLSDPWLNPNKFKLN